MKHFALLLAFPPPYRLNGGIYFREFMTEDFLQNNIVGFFAGVVLIFTGVYLLAPRRKPSFAANVSPVTVDDGTDSISARQRSGSSGEPMSVDGLMVLFGDNEQEEAESQQVFWEQMGLESLIPMIDGIFETNFLDWAFEDDG